MTQRHLPVGPGPMENEEGQISAIEDPQPLSTSSLHGPCAYPARPSNGGILERALPKVGQWFFEPKYNGWRTLVHAPTGAMFNRYGQPLTIQREFSLALTQIRKLRLVSEAGVVEWFDCEALERRHRLGQGVLLVFDYILSGNHEPYAKRHARLARALPVHHYAVPPEPDRVYAVTSLAPGALDALAFYHRLRCLNRQWRCTFYEGVVAKRSDSLYPLQLRSPALEFPLWMKHRWSA